MYIFTPSFAFRSNSRSSRYRPLLGRRICNSVKHVLEPNGHGFCEIAYQAKATSHGCISIHVQGELREIDSKNSRAITGMSCAMIQGKVCLHRQPAIVLQHLV